MNFPPNVVASPDERKAPRVLRCSAGDIHLMELLMDEGLAMALGLASLHRHSPLSPCFIILSPTQYSHLLPPPKSPWGIFSPLSLLSFSLCMLSVPRSQALSLSLSLNVLFYITRYTLYFFSLCSYVVNTYIYTCSHIAYTVSIYYK